MLKMVLRFILLAMLTVCLAAFEQRASAAGGFGQASNEADAFFSGTVVDNSPERVTVSRSIQGKSPERRSFIINSDTTIEGKLKNNSRVTVRFAPSESGDVALSIIVREGSGRNGK
jgi:hypothetical protein